MFVFGTIVMHSFCGTRFRFRKRGDRVVGHFIKPLVDAHALSIVPSERQDKGAQPQPTSMVALNAVPASPLARCMSGPTVRRAEKGRSSP